MTAFRDFRILTKQSWPVPSSEFAGAFNHWTNSGTVHPDVRRLFGFDRSSKNGVDGVTSTAWVAVSILSRLPKYAAATEAMPTYHVLHKFVSESNKQAANKQPPVPADAAYQISYLWNTVFTEQSAVAGTVWSIALVTFAAAVAVYISSLSARVCVATLLCMLGVISTVLAAFVGLGWSVGIVEAISISILLGSTVDYPLHLCEAVTGAARQALEAADDASLDSWTMMQRAEAVQIGLAAVGGPIIHAGTTTILAVICCSLCDTLIFVKLGLIIAVSTAVSIIYTLLPLPLLLLTIGEEPAFAPYPSPARYIRACLCVVCSMGLGIGTLFVLSSAGVVSILGPSGSSLFG